jgi:hypothetical protein
MKRRGRFYANREHTAPASCQASRYDDSGYWGRDLPGDARRALSIGGRVFRNFTAKLAKDEDGLVIDYATLFMRLPRTR